MAYAFEIRARIAAGCRLAGRAESGKYIWAGEEQHSWLISELEMACIRAWTAVTHT